MVNKMVMITIYLGSEKRAIVRISVFYTGEVEKWWSSPLKLVTFTGVFLLHVIYFEAASTGQYAE